MEKNDQNKTSSNENSSTIINRRSRFPRAQPNVTVSSGLARIRRLSGHFSTINSSNIDEETTANNENVQSSTIFQYNSYPLSKHSK